MNKLILICMILIIPSLVNGFHAEMIDSGTTFILYIPINNVTLVQTSAPDFWTFKMVKNSLMYGTDSIRSDFNKIAFFECLVYDICCNYNQYDDVESNAQLKDKG